MIKKLLILVIALCLISFGMEAKRPEHVSHERHKNRMSNSNRTTQKRLSAGDRFDPTEFQPIRGEWQPCKEKYYRLIWSEKDNDWKVDYSNEYVYNYNTDGLVIKSTRSYNSSEYKFQYITDYKYNDDMYLVEYQQSDSDGDCNIYGSFVYDPIITDLVVKYTLITEYNSGNSYCFGDEKVIERNDVNDIVRFIDYDINNEDGRQELRAVSITYKNGQVTDILWRGNNSRLTDIVWENFNGQIYDLGDTPDDPVGCRLYHGDNRLKHAKWIEDGELYAVIDVEYKESGFTLKLDYEDGEYDLYDYSYGEFGGYDVINIYNYGKIDIFSDIWGTEYDRFGIKTLEYSGTYNLETEEVTLEDVYYTDIVYNDEYGYPETVVCFTKEGEADPAIQSKTEYSDWINTSLSEVTLIEADEDAQFEYYTLDGLKVKHPIKGLYIRRQGQKTEKIYVNK